MMMDSCGPGNHLLANPICEACGVDVRVEQVSGFIKHLEKLKTDLPWWKFWSRYKIERKVRILTSILKSGSTWTRLRMV